MLLLANCCFLRPSPSDGNRKQMTEQGVDVTWRGNQTDYLEITYTPLREPHITNMAEFDALTFIQPLETSISSTAPERYAAQAKPTLDSSVAQSAPIRREINWSPVVLARERARPAYLPNPTPTT